MNIHFMPLPYAPPPPPTPSPYPLAPNTPSVPNQSWASKEKGHTHTASNQVHLIIQASCWITHVYQECMSV